MPIYLIYGDGNLGSRCKVIFWHKKTLQGASGGIDNTITVRLCWPISTSFRLNNNNLKKYIEPLFILNIGNTYFMNNLIFGQMVSGKNGQNNKKRRLNYINCYKYFGW